MQLLHPVEMRLELKQGINNCSIINDSYSADLHSLSIALDFLSQQNQHPKHTVILSDILQSGKPVEELYSIVASFLLQRKVKRLIAIGTQIKSAENQFDFLPEKLFYNSVSDFKKDFYNLHFNNESILIKGARIFEFEQIQQLLEHQAHQTVLSINLTAIAYNLKMYKQMLHRDTKIMAMVKAFSYGSGSYEIANLLQFNKVDYLAVAYADEGVELRKAGITMPIMVMNPEENSFNALVQHNLEPELFSFGLLFSFEKYLRSAAINYYPVHIKLDTGMHRLGFELHEMDDLAGHLAKNKVLKVQSVFTHLAASENAQLDDFTKRQSNIFLQCCHILETHLQYKFLKHISNTAAVSRHTTLQLDMVRLGIGLYGVDNNVAVPSQLKNVSTLTTTIAQLRKVKAGENVGYGGNAKVTEDSVIATVCIGYADGYPRSLGNGIGKMLVKDKTVNVIGNVCMDMTMLDVTNLKDVTEKDDVIVFGEDLTIKMLADWAGTIPYEIMTGISQRVKRIYFEE